MSTQNKTTRIHWFRNDQRLSDQPWMHDLDEVEHFFGVYILDPIHFTRTKNGFRRMSSVRLKWLRESLSELQFNLRGKGSDLLVRVGNPAMILSELAQEYNASVSFSNEFAFEEVHQESELKKMNVKLYDVSCSELISEIDLPFSIFEMPNQFTAFRNKLEKKRNWDVFECIDSPAQLPPTPVFFPELKKSSRIADTRSAIPFVGGETQALLRVNDYIHRNQSIAHYKSTRNELIGSEYSTKFSCWLANGNLHPKRIMNEIRRFESLHGATEHTYWVWFELLWREFFRLQHQKHGVAFFKVEGLNGQKPSFRTSDRLVNAWILGETKNEFVNANMKELRQTGFMSNRGRQNVAAFLIYDLGLDWRLGALYFESALIDYDVYSNQGNWAYIAGVGNDPRGGRAFNVEDQALRYDSLGRFQALWNENDEA